MTQNMHDIKRIFHKLQGRSISPLDILPHNDVCEKLIDLVVNGEPPNLPPEIGQQFSWLRRCFIMGDVENVRVVVFGGGSGLSNIIGGDSRLEGWAKNPFSGLKDIFPKTKSIVCVTDDGGSTGELIKDLPIIALGDIRHVLLSSIQKQRLRLKYNLTEDESIRLVEALAELCNMRLKENQIDEGLLAGFLERYKDNLPEGMFGQLEVLTKNLFIDKRLRSTLTRPHCLGNLFLASSIYRNIDSSLINNEDIENNPDIVSNAVLEGIEEICDCIGVEKDSVTPCTTTPAHLRFCYSNGVDAIGENKSSESDRGYPVDRVIVDFSDIAKVPQRIRQEIEAADILILAPGSLYSSIIPIFQVPGIAEAVRGNRRAQKILISNLWVQAGETDISMADQERKFHVSDMIRAYERNIPGGTNGLFSEVLCISLKDVPGSVLQNYAIEGKIPIYLDKEIVEQQGFIPIECGIYNKKALADRGVIQHDPDFLATAVKTIYLSRDFRQKKEMSPTPKVTLKEGIAPARRPSLYPTKKYRCILQWVRSLYLNSSERQNSVNEDKIREKILETIWKHQDIPTEHLAFVDGIELIEEKKWKRNQKWDNVFSFYDPTDKTIKIRNDQIDNQRNFETALLIATGQSLLGNYAKEKKMTEVLVDDAAVGKIYHLTVEKNELLNCFFSMAEIKTFLNLARMNSLDKHDNHFIRVINGAEGFTPPGVLMGLSYAWYLDNRLASHIEYKMAVTKISESSLIPEQRKMKDRRNAIVNFFREVVFMHC